jgi:DNA-binding NtrC family response regulator
MAQILSFGIDRNYLDERAIILNKAGFRVSSAEQKNEALRLAQLSAPRMVIFGHRVPPKLRQSMARSFREINPEIKLIFVYQGEKPESQLADAMVPVQAPPDELVTKVRELLKNVETAY